MGKIRDQFKNDGNFTVDRTHVTKGNTAKLRDSAMADYQDAINGIFEDWKGEPVMIVRVVEDKKNKPTGRRAVIVGVGGIPSLVELVDAAADVMKDVMETVENAIKEGK